MPRSTAARTMLVVGAPGTGKSAFARRRALAAGGRVVRTDADWFGAEQARRGLTAAMRGRPPLVAIDDAQLLIGTDAEAALEALVRAPPVDRLIVVSRTPPTFEFRPDALVTAPDLAVGLADIVTMFREHGGHRIDLEAAAHVAQATLGWPELVRRLAVAPGPRDESYAHALDDELRGDIAAAWLEESLHPLAGSLVDALTRAAVLPDLDLARATRVLGFADAAALIAAIDAGVVMHMHAALGRRMLPPLLRRHLLDRMPPADRRRAAEVAARIMIDVDDPAGAADCLASGGAWSALAELLDASPHASRGASRWIGIVPAHVIRSVPAVAAAAERARREDRESVHLASTAVPFAPRTPSAPGPTGPPGPAAEHFARAIRHLLRGDVAGAVPLLRRCLLAMPARRTEFLARLALAVIRAPIAGAEATEAALASVERDARNEGRGGLARIVRGAIATTCGVPDRATVRCVIEQLESRDDLDGAVLISALDLLASVRRGEPHAATAIALADRADRLGMIEVGAWARAAAVLAASAIGTPAHPDVGTAAKAGAITSGLPGIRAVLETASALGSPSPARERRLAAARRLALESGLLRVPIPRVAAGEHHRQAATSTSTTATAPGPAVPAVTERSARLEVACFGGFRIRLDGMDADLRAIRPQARAVLRMLALNAGAPLHRDLIASLLWGELSADSALHALHVSVSSLRRMLPAEVDGGGIVERVGEAYRIGIADRRDCDLASFDDRLAAAADAKLRGDAATARDGLVGALELYVGDVLPEDGPAEWAVGARDRYRLRAAEAANSLAHLHSRLGDPRAAVTAAHRAVEIDPWVDESWRTLIAMHRRAGDVIAGQRAEDGYRSMRRALGVD